MDNYINIVTHLPCYAMRASNLVHFRPGNYDISANLERLLHLYVYANHHALQTVHVVPELIVRDHLIRLFLYDH